MMSFYFLFKQYSNMSSFRAVFSLLFSFGILLLANGLFNTLIAIKAKQADFPYIGLILSGFFLGLLISSRYAIKLIAKIGYIRAFASSASVVSVVALFHLLWTDPFFWGILRVISGFCIGTMIIITEGWINEKATNKNRGTLISIYMITTYACLGGTQLFIMFDTDNGFHLFVIISILFSLALLPILTTQTTAPQIERKTQSINFLFLFRISPVGMIGTFVVGFCNGIFYALAPIYAVSLGLDLADSSIFMALGIASGMLLQFPLGKLSDHIDRRWVIFITAGLTSMACFMLAFYNIESFIPIYVLAVFYGSTGFAINPLCIAHVNDLAPSDQRAQTASNMMLFYGMGAVLGPIFAGFFLPSGEYLIFIISGSLILLFTLYTLARLLIKPRNLDAKIKFQPFSSNSPTRKLNFENETIVTTAEGNAKKATAKSPAQNTIKQSSIIDEEN